MNSALKELASTIWVLLLMALMSLPAAFYLNGKIESQAIEIRQIHEDMQDIYRVMRYLLIESIEKDLPPKDLDLGGVMDSEVY